MSHNKAADLFNPGCPLVALGTSSNNDSLGEILKFGIQCGFRVLSMSDEHKNSHLIGSSLHSLITGEKITSLSFSRAFCFNVNREVNKI